MGTANISASRRYAKALRESAKDIEQAKNWLPTLESFSAIYQDSHDLKVLFATETFDDSEKTKVFEEILSKLGGDATLLNFFRTLQKSSRLGEFPSIVEIFRQNLLFEQGREDVLVETAMELTTTQVDKISAALEKTFKKTFLVKVQVSEDLLAGIRVHLLGKTFDASLQSNLDIMKDKLLAVQ